MKGPSSEGQGCCIKRFSRSNPMSPKSLLPSEPSPTHLVKDADGGRKLSPKIGRLQHPLLKGDVRWIIGLLSKPNYLGSIINPIIGCWVYRIPGVIDHNKPKTNSVINHYRETRTIQGNRTLLVLVKTQYISLKGRPTGAIFVFLANINNRMQFLS